MATAQIVFTDSTWQEVGTGLSVLVCQAVGTTVQLHIGVAPTAADVGFDLPQGMPIEVPTIANLGGAVFVRSIHSRGAFRYASA